MKKASIIILVLLITVSGYSQESPVLKVNDKPLGLSSLNIKVDIVGNIATTTYDMLFHNPTNSVLEGELSFPLGEGHNVSRFALDVNGKLREAVVVDKELGRIAFEQVVRRGVDPALLEKGTGNNYKARIYPIPANGYKRVVLAYEQELILNDGDQYYNLPLNFKNKLDAFKLEILVFNQKEQPVIEKGKISGLEFSNWEKHYRTSITKKGYIPNIGLLIKIPVPIDTEKILFYDDYFYIYKTLLPQIRQREKPNKIALFWDASLSMENRKLDKELDLLGEYFKYLKEVTVCFVSFSNTILIDQEFNIVNGNWADLKKEIEQTIYDGGTAYDVLLNKKNDADIKLLFSDGITSLSDIDLNEEKPIFIINSIAKSNHTALKYKAELSNGAYINLNAKSNFEGLSRLKFESYKFLGYKSDSKELEIYPKEPMSVSNDFSISGKNFKNGDRVILNFGYGNEISQSISVDINDSKTTTNKKIIRIWAQKKSDYLEINHKKNKTQITKLGIDYSLVTDYTSLIVLEDVMDYIRYKITPPEELLEEYNNILAKIESLKSKRNEEIDLSLGLLFTPRNAQLLEDEMEDEEVLFRSEQNRRFGEVEVTYDEVVEIEDIDVDEAGVEMETTILNGLVSNFTIVDSNSVSRTKYKGDLSIKKRKLDIDYIVALRKVKNKYEAYSLYLSQRKNYLKTPVYYTDVSNHFKEAYNDVDYSSRILSNIAELDFDNYELLKVFAYQLQANNQDRLALFIFKRILELRPEDAQSYRDLALAYQNVSKCQEALDLFNSIITGDIYKNNNRRVFEGITLIAKNEIKYLIKKYRDDLDLSEINKELLNEVTYDIRVVVDWNHNDTDIDLHIIDPNLEECFYSHPSTKIGGRMSPDMTQGFGPEEFVLKNAVKGDYFVKIKYYGDRYQKADNPTFMKVTMFKNYGSKNETKETQIIRLTKSDDEEIIAKLTF